MNINVEQIKSEYPLGTEDGIDYTIYPVSGGYSNEV